MHARLLDCAENAWSSGKCNWVRQTSAYTKGLYEGDRAGYDDFERCQRLSDMRGERSAKYVLLARRGKRFEALVQGRIPFFER